MASSIFQRSLPRLLSQTNRCSWKTFNTTAVNHLFYEKSRKGDYDQHSATKVSKKQHILNGLRQLKNEVKLWQEEVKEHLKMDPILIYRPGEVDIAYRFNSSESLDKWVVSTDSDHNQGFSTAALETSPAGYGLFHGTVRSDVPKDGRVKRAGYCNVKSLRARKSFKREIYLDWTQYNTLGNDFINYLSSVIRMCVLSLQF